MEKSSTPSTAKRSPVKQLYFGDTVTSIFKELKTNEAGRIWPSYSISQQRRWYSDKQKKTIYSESLFEQDLLYGSEGLVTASHWIETDRQEERAKANQEDSEANGAS